MSKKKLSINKETIKNLKVKSNIKTGGTKADCYLTGGEIGTVGGVGEVGTVGCITVYPCDPKPTLGCITLK